jgi:hypothetical protein
LGRFRRQQVPRGNAQRALCTGRLMVDTYKNAKDFLREVRTAAAPVRLLAEARSP